MEYFIIGAGGHAKVVIETALINSVEINGILDDFYGSDFTSLMGVSLVGKINVLATNNIYRATIAIGNNRIRKNIASSYQMVKWRSVLHHNTIISSTAYIGEGTVIMAGAIIQAGAKIGRHCIINTGACVDHDCVIDDYVHIAPGVTLAGGVKVGEGTLVGVGTSIVPYVTVGKWATIGAGSAVISDIPDYSTAVGVPAIIKKINNESI